MGGKATVRKRWANTQEPAQLEQEPRVLLVVENNVEKGTVNLQGITGLIINEPQFPKPVHEKADPRASCANHLRQSFLAEMVGTTRSRVSFFMNRFRKLGFIDYQAGDALQVHSSLLNIVLHD